MDRRRFFKAGAALSGLLAIEFAPWHSIAAVAREVDDFVRGPALRDHPLRQVSPHVWMIHSPDGFPTPENQGMMCNLTFIDTAQGLVVVDSGASVQIGEMAIRQIKKQWQKPVVAIINTHYHGDHWLGNHAFVDAYGAELPIYAHPGTIREIEGVQGKLWRTLLEQWTNQATMGTRIVPPRLALAYARRNAELQANLQPIAGAVDAVRAVHALLGGRIACASGADRQKVEMQLAQVGLASYFGDRVFSGHEMPRTKPAPDVYLAAAAALKVDPARCLVVEDTVTGVTAGVAAGATVVGFSPSLVGHGAPEALLAAGAVRVIAHMSELPALLG